MPSDEQLSSFLEDICYEDDPPALGDLKKVKFTAHMVVHFVLWCLSGKTGGIDAIVKDLLRLLWGVYYDKNIDFGGILWNDFRQYVVAKKAEVPFARFWSIILNKIIADPCSASSPPTLNALPPSDNFRDISCALWE